MRTADIAKRYLDYFAKHDHLVMPSASLISPNPTTLFTIAGMVPFIPYLLGEQTPPKRRMTSNQKCVRTLDIDEVGKTTRHGTFVQDRPAHRRRAGPEEHRYRRRSGTSGLPDAGQTEHL